MPTALIESLDHEGRGVAHVEGKTIFIEGGLPGETVEYSSFRKKPKYEQATLTQVHQASSQRVEPKCPHFGVCGGCSMQHIGVKGQTAAKQRVLEDALWHVGRLRPDIVFPPIAGQEWGYRHRARLSARVVAKKGGVLVGFHEKRSSYVAVMDSCAVLPAQISALIPKFKLMIAAMSTPDRLPQIEVSVGATLQGTQTALVLRHLEPLTSGDEQILREFADANGIVWYLQPKGPETAWLFHPTTATPLAYGLPEFDLEMQFSPTEFTQVNHGVNQMLIRRAIRLLAPKAGERIADLFCGLGNFSLPIARSGAHVVGIEGSKGLVERARQNAANNGLAERCEFRVANLFTLAEGDYAKLAGDGPAFDKLLIDPPRDGAAELVKALPLEGGPQRIVYVSCSPGTLARDAAVLVHEKSFRLAGAGIASMFPHTSHVESIAVFDRG
ncbi:MAG: 23S rRNA (uracil(1939)-C(5))-methyltransferase RlmD [Rhodocyclaceae bacterium]|nr:23S rRNA (uracil(1939)-C(5))-methyltransferase RlmD [Rhodocyclaceae bacterium]